MPTLNPSLAIASHSLNALSHYLADCSYSQATIFSHPSLWELYGSILTHHLEQLGWKSTVCLIPEGEKSKSLTQIRRCWQHLSTHQADRQSVVIAFGGGVICDLAGFAASCYMRGLETIYLPTSLLAMVDAAIGGKTGINFNRCKNLIGTFHSPKKIIIDPALLETLPEREFNAGFAEVIKYGVIHSPFLLDWIEQHWTRLKQKESGLLEEVIKVSCAIKQEIVREDFQDLGIRATLNYGHTFGHAIESLTDYKVYLHGEAVAIGMSCAAHVSYQMGLTDRLTVQKQDSICQLIGLPTQLPLLSIDRLLAKMKTDKKATTGKISLILPEKIGKVIKVSSIESAVIKQILQKKKPANAFL